MKQIDDKTLRMLIARFMEGATTNAEERQIFARFEQGAVPDDLEQFRPMMSWLAGGMPAVEPSIPTAIRRWSKSSLAACISAAASLALIVSVSFSFMDGRTSGLAKEDYITYAGSYIIRDGKKITDLDVIMPELERAEKIVERYSSAESRIQSLNKYINVDNPAVKAALESAFAE